MPSPSLGLGGVSSLMTSAPQSANWRTAVGPARTRVKSNTRKRDNGPCPDCVVIFVSYSAITIFGVIVTTDRTLASVVLYAAR